MKVSHSSVAVSSLRQFGEVEMTDVLAIATGGREMHLASSAVWGAGSGWHYRPEMGASSISAKGTPWFVLVLNVTTPTKVVAAVVFRTTGGKAPSASRGRSGSGAGGWAMVWDVVVDDGAIPTSVDQNVTNTIRGRAPTGSSLSGRS